MEEIVGGVVEKSIYMRIRMINIDVWKKQERKSWKLTKLG